MRLLKIGFLIGSCGLLSSCTEKVFEVLAISQLQVDPLTSTLVPGTSVQLNARASSADGTLLSGRTVAWSSSNTAVASVSGTGLLQAVAPGTATISASSEGQGTTLGITVQSLPPTVSSISPNSAPRATAFQLTVTGTGFYSGSVVQINNVARTTQFVSATTLRVSVAATDFPSAGTATVRVVNPAPGGGTSSSFNLTLTVPQMTIVINNQLLRSINVDINGVFAGIVAATSIGQFSGPQVPITVSYTLNRHTTTAGVPVGETMAGIFNAVTNPGLTETFIVNNVLGSQQYFAPVIDNFTNVPLLMGVNMGLTAENRCNCVVPANTLDVEIGYYRLFSNSNVRAYNSNSNYTGGFVFWEGNTIVGAVTPGSGRADLFTTITPNNLARAGGWIGLPDVVWQPFDRLWHNDDVPRTEVSNARAPLANQRWIQTVREHPSIEALRKPEGG